ncbi:MAG: PAS domain S-box protein [Terrimicrobiaceae bacterium]
MHIVSPSKKSLLAKIAGLRSLLERIRTQKKLAPDEGVNTEGVDGVGANFFLPIMELTPGVLHVYDLEEKSLVFINPKMANILGYSPEEWEAMGEKVLPNLMSPEDVPRFEEHIAHVRTLADHERADFECRMRNSSGEWRWFQCVTSVFAREAHGAVRQVISSALDITERKKAAEELRSSEKKNQFLAGIIERSSQPFGVGYLDGRLGLVNPAFERLTGYSAAELRALDWATKLTPPEWREMEREKLEELQLTGQPVRYEKEYRRKDGTLVPVELLVDQAKDSEGRVEYYYSFITDITARKQSQEALRHSEQLHRMAFDLAPEGIAYVGLDQRLIKVNQRLCEITGYSVDELLTMNVLSLTHPDDRAADGALFQEFLLSGTPKYENAKRYQRKDGGIRWVVVTARMVTDADGNPIHTIGVIRDITELKDIENDLQQSERAARRNWAETEAALEAIPANIAIIDGNGVILRVNSAWSAFAAESGGNPEALGVGVNYLAACDVAGGQQADQANSFASGIRSVLSGGRSHFSLEYPCHSPVRQRWFMAYVTATQGEGPSRAVIAHVDINPQKRIEEEIRSLNRDLEVRVGSRTTLLQSAVDQLESEIVERQRLERELLEISEREQSRFGQDLHDGLSQELAGMAMIGGVLAKRLQVETHPSAKLAADLSTAIRSTIDSARLLAKGLYPVELDRFGLVLALEDLANRTSQRYGIECELKVNGKPQHLEKANKIHIYRIVQECIGNAIKHGHAKRIVIEAEASDDGHHFSVTDNGRGFHQTAGSAGMGLHLMEYRARVIGGEISIEKPVQGGCRINCRIPGTAA